MSSKSSMCRTQSRTNILLKTVIILGLIWIAVLILSEYTGVSLDESKLILQWILVISIPSFLIIYLWMKNRELRA